MLDHFGYIDLAEKVVQAIESVLVEGDNITPDLGGNASTAEMGDKIVNKILEG